MSRKPNLFIVGAPKCGTTAWYEYLRRHPDIAFSDAKEPHYFCTDLPGFRWAKTEESYLKLFEDLPDKKYIGEASIMYLYSKVAIRNIHEFNPDAKILIFIRNYETFFQSYHSQLYLTHDEDEPDPEKAWNLQDVRLAGESIPGECRDASFLQYREVARFGDQIKRVQNFLPDEQIKIVIFEEWIKDPKSAYNEILNFLKLESDGFNDFKTINTKRKNRSRRLSRFLRRPPKPALAASRLISRILGRKRLNLASKIKVLNETPKQEHSSLSPELATEIRRNFASDRRELEAILGRSISDWPTSDRESTTISTASNLASGT